MVRGSGSGSFSLEKRLIAKLNPPSQTPVLFSRIVFVFRVKILRVAAVNNHTILAHFGFETEKEFLDVVVDDIVEILLGLTENVIAFFVAEKGESNTVDDDVHKTQIVASGLHGHQIQIPLEVLYLLVNVWGFSTHARRVLEVFDPQTNVVVDQHWPGQVIAGTHLIAESVPGKT